MNLSTLSFEQLIGGTSLLLILSVLSVAALLQGNHDALVALISLVTGAGVGVAAARTATG